MKLGSLFDGIGGFPLAATMNGIRPVWASEIEPFPMAVTAYRFPEMKHMGDITKLHGESLPVEVPRVRICPWPGRGKDCPGIVPAYSWSRSES